MDDIILDRNTDGYRVTSMDALDEISLVWFFCTRENIIYNTIKVVSKNVVNHL
jgi:hypothetical protein